VIDEGHIQNVQGCWYFRTCLRTTALGQGFPTTFLGPPNTACFPCLLDQTHLIQIISSLAETPRPEMGVSDKGDMQNISNIPGTWLGTTALGYSSGKFGSFTTSDL